MSWTLDIQRGSGGPIVASRSNINPTGVLDGFNWRTAPSEDCIDCDFEGFIDQLGLQNRDLIRVKVNGTAVFFGPVVELPHPRDRKRGAVNAVGARDLLSRRVIGTEKYTNIDVASIAALLVARYKHPALAYDPVNFPDTGRVLSEFTMPWRTLEQALETLSKSVSPDRPVPYGVRADGHVFFGSFSAPSLNLKMADLSDLQWLRVSGDDVVTRSYLIALSRPSGTPPTRIVNSPGGYRGTPGDATSVPNGSGPLPAALGPPYQPAAYAFCVEDSQWADLEAEASNLLPDGADVLTAPGQNIPALNSSVGLDNPGHMQDGDAATFAVSLDGAERHDAIYLQEEDLDADPLVGFRLVYSLDMADQPATGWQAEANFTYVGRGVNITSWVFNLTSTTGQRTELVALLPVPVEIMWAAGASVLGIQSRTMAQTRLGITVFPLVDTYRIPGGRFKIFTFEPLRLDRVKLDTLARSYLRPPAQEPTELTLAGLRPAAFAVTVADAPGGALSADVSEIEGHLTPEGDVKTVIKLEQPGASVEARMLRLVAQRNALDAQTQLRGFLER